jgi:hypothetical protein
VRRGDAGEQVKSRGAHAAQEACDVCDAFGGLPLIPASIATPLTWPGGRRDLARIEAMVEACFQSADYLEASARSWKTPARPSLATDRAAAVSLFHQDYASRSCSTWEALTS